MSEDTAWLESGSKWEHHSGRVYRIVMLTNVNTERPAQYPVTVVYENVDNGTVWSRPVDEWTRSFKPYRTKEQRERDALISEIESDLEVLGMEDAEHLAGLLATGMINRGWRRGEDETTQAAL